VRKRLLKRALLFMAAGVVTLAFAGAASAGTYIVLYKAQGLPANGGATVRAAGGTVVASSRRSASSSPRQIARGSAPHS
jgi:hypothetical protein